MDERDHLKIRYSLARTLTPDEEQLVDLRRAISELERRIVAYQVC